MANHSTAFREKLGKQWLFFDGGTGSLLQKRGLQPGELPETWNLTHPEDIIAVHQAYLEAGSDVFYTNTFGANRLKYPDADELQRIVRASVELAQEARRRAGREDAFVALDLGPCGKMLEPMGDLPFEAGVELFADVVREGTAAGADLIVVETMNDLLEARAAVLAARENSDLPVVATLVFDASGRMLTGGTPESAVAMMESLGVDAVGMNCSLGPRNMLPLAKRFLAASSLPVIIKPNAGLPRVEDGKTVYDVGPEEFAGVMAEIAALGVHVVGGCCGTDPGYIRALKPAVLAQPFQPPVRKQRTIVSSFSRCVEIGAVPVLIGERINPTGKKRFKEALKSHDIEYILGEGLKQEEAGADILDVNVGLPGIDEPAMMREVVEKLQNIQALPLQLDTSDPAAMEAGMRACCGRPLINSVNGKKESMEAIFPLVQKYGGVVVGLPLDETGIPADADGRIRIARHIYETAAAYGIPKEDILIDGLTMTVSSDPSAALVTLETIRRVRDELGGHTVLGVSNVSFGLPQREYLNAAFLTMAVQNGLSAAIINPGSAVMMQAWHASKALLEQDLHFERYIAVYGQSAAETGVAGGAAAAGTPASDAGDQTAGPGSFIERGIAGGAAAAAAKMLGTVDPLSIINQELVPALDKVGAAFEKGTLFLPQLLMSAEAAKQTFEVVKAAMPVREDAVKGRVILATVHGDIHDIGKNIVKILLETYGYEVLDLGRDVAAERIVETALAEGIRLVGLSALMTTTVPAMEETIRLLRAEKPDTKIVVGGAVLTQEYADEIGADCYAGDAMATVHYADEIFAAV